MTLNENIRSIRKAHHLTQEQLAEAMGVSTASVSKWETGQSAPELSMLAELADFFGVSVDALMGHTVRSGRMESLMAELESLDEVRRYDEAKTVAEKLLRRWPNSYEVVDKVSALYHNAYLLSKERADMDRAIELTQRLFALVEDPTGAKRFELLSRMAGHYENLEDWTMARKYYEEGNVGRLNDRALARCMANEGKNAEAAEALSGVFSIGLGELISDCVMLGKVWQEHGCPEKAEAALKWACGAMESLGRETAATFGQLTMALYLNLAFLQDEQGRGADAERSIRTAVRIAREGGSGTSCDFLTVDQLKVAVITRESGVDLPLALIREKGSSELLAAALDEAGLEA